MKALTEQDINRLHEAQQSVDLAVAPIRAITNADDPLLAEFGLELCEQINKIHSKLNRLVALSKP